jgi:lipid II:glycine glycyltransferase (peptidoglycan interpeptide bridge formation enzyme)
LAFGSIKHNLLFGWSYFYCPRGLISQKFIKSPNQSFQDATGQAKIESQNSIELFFEGVKKMAKKEKAVFLRIDPTVCKCCPEFQQCHPELVSESVRFQNKPACNALYSNASRFGMTEDKFAMTREAKPTQPRHTLILDITKSEEEILARMKQKTRYNIRLAERKGVKIKKISRPNDQEIQTFLNLSIQTSERDKFQIHPKKYYQKMLKILGENSTAKLFFAEYQNEIIAANIVIFFSGKAVYLHGASSNIHRQAMAPHLLHWEQIKNVTGQAKNRKIKLAGNYKI